MLKTFIHFFFKVISGSAIVYFAVFFSGSCARIMAANMMTHPISSFKESFCPRSIQPASTEMQDSRERIREATVGFTFFWPTICRV